MAPKPRRVSVAIIVAADSLQDEPAFLMVTSRKHDDKFVLPKGGIEEGEDPAEAGLREAWEEAGLILGSAIHIDHLVILSDNKAHDKSPSKDPTQDGFVACTTYSFELFLLRSPDRKLADDWPERSERKGRKWVIGFDALEKEVQWGRRGPIMLEAVRLARSRLAPTSFRPEQ